MDRFFLNSVAGLADEVAGGNCSERQARREYSYKILWYDPKKRMNARILASDNEGDSVDCLKRLAELAFQYIRYGNGLRVNSFIADISPVKHEDGRVRGGHYIVSPGKGFPEHIQKYFVLLNVRES